MDDLKAMLLLEGVKKKYPQVVEGYPVHRNFSHGNETWPEYLDLISQHLAANADQLQKLG